MTSRTTGGYELPAVEGRAEYIRKNFDAIAGTYDRFNDIITFGMHRAWKRRVVRLTGLEAGAGHRHVLDLCAGSGDLSIALAGHLGSGSRVTSLDYSPGMLKILKQRLSALATAPGAPRADITVIEGDATDLGAFADGSIDAITLGFGLRNVQDRAACLRETWRVLRPGARLVILDAGKVRGRIPAFFHRIYFERIVPRIGHFLQGEHTEMYEYLPASTQVYPGPEELTGELRAAGYESVRFYRLLLGAAVIHVAQKSADSA
jgi:demethylmenaquinone methyltransferase/2-methoxy-6-polyprenyl-1,4-benzoquinol methylase